MGWGLASLDVAEELGQTKTALVSARAELSESRVAQQALRQQLAKAQSATTMMREEFASALQVCVGYAKAANSVLSRLKGVSGPSGHLGSQETEQVESSPSLSLRPESTFPSATILIGFKRMAELDGSPGAEKRPRSTK